MRKVSLSLLLTRSDGEWRIGKKGGDAYLKASVGDKPIQPPTSQWRFINFDTGYYEDDANMRCSTPSTSTPCCLTVNLSGAAKEAQAKCEGEYKSTGLVSAGREVQLQFDKNFHFSLKVFELEGSSDFYLFVKPGFSTWAIRSNLESAQRFIRSGSAGQACPAHPRNKFSKRGDSKDWGFNKAKEDDDEEDWEEGGVVVQCSVHQHCST